MKPLSTLLLTYTSWFFGLAKKMGSLSPLNLGVAILFFLINQITQVLVVFVPIKLLVIIGAGSTPRFISAVFPGVGYQEMIIYLSVATAVVYLLYVMSDVVMSQTSRFGAAKVGLHANKLSLIDNQVQFTESVYSKVVGTQGGMLMVLGGFALGLWLEWRVFGLILSLMVLEYVAVAYYWGKIQNPDAVSKRIRFIAKRIALLRSFSALNFVAGFVVLVNIFINEDYNFLIALVSILLIRQVMIRFILAVSDGIYLYQNEAKISALFFADVKLQETIGHDDKQFLEALLPSHRELIFSEISKVSGIDLQTYSWQWIDMPGRNIAIFLGRQGENEILLKVFSIKQEKHYLTESLLIGALKKHPLIMPMLAFGQACGVFFIIQRGPVGQPPAGQELLQSQKDARLLSWGFNADSSIVDRLARSKPLVHERLIHHDLNVLALADVDASNIRSFSDNLHRALKRVSQLPVFVWNKNMSATNVYVNERLPHLVSWHTVAVEPIGSGSTVKELESMETAGELQQLCAERSDCENIHLCDLKLVSLLHHFEAALIGQNFQLAARQMPTLETVIDECLGSANESSLS